MNSGRFKTVFSERLGALVAVGEHASSQGQGKGAGPAGGGSAPNLGGNWLLSAERYMGVLTGTFALASLAWAGPVATTALPTGGQVAQGAASIHQSGAVMNIQQSTNKAVVNWNTFDIGSAAKVNIVQPGTNAVMLNRVTSANPSQILGQLNANGQVVLVNPNGILFGKDGSVNASSFTASTLGISDANFMAGQHQFERNGATAAVLNQGSLKTTGGYVALLGASVSNEGKIETNGGTAYLAAAENIQIPVSGSGRIKLELSPSSINAAVANAKGGTIVTEGGQVYMQAAALNSAVASILQSGSIDTTGEQGGAVHLLADGGQIQVDGTITANSTGKDGQNQPRKGGDIIIGRDEETGVLAASTDVTQAKLESTNGFVETSGEHLQVDGIQIKAKDWLLDPSDINITADGTSESNLTSNAGTLSPTTPGTTTSIKASTIVGALATTNVLVQTGTTDAGNGDITVGSAITAAAGNTNSLTLKAARSVNVNSAIDVKGGNLNLLANTDGTLSTGSVRVNATLSGNNISLDNTGGSVDPTTGVITPGSVAGPSVTGVRIAQAITTTGNLNVAGVSSGTSFPNVGVNYAAPISAGGAVNIYGKGGNVSIFSQSTITSGSGGVSINGSDTGLNMGGGANVTSSGTVNITGNVVSLTGNTPVFTSGAVTIQGASVNITGTHNSPASTNQGVNMTQLNTITATAGDVVITGNVSRSGVYGVHLNANVTATGNTTVSGSNSASGNTAYGVLFAGGTITGSNGNNININGFLHGSRPIVLGGATLNFNNAFTTSTYEYGGVISGTGAVVNQTGYQTLAAVSTFTGTTSVSGGTLRLGGSTAASLGANSTGIFIGSGATLLLSYLSSATISAPLSGAGNLIQNNGATAILTGDNSGFTGTATVNSTRTLQLGNGGAIGNFGANASVVDNGALIFNLSASPTVAGVISGTGALTQTGAGTTILTGTNTYTGTTTISGGTLQIGKGGTTGTLGTGPVSLSNNANLSFVRAAATTMGNSISGTGNVSASITGASNALTVSSRINLTGGTVNLASDNNLSVTAAIATTNTTDSAVLLNAGKSISAGTSTGGDLLFSGSGAVTVGSGGRATLMSGSVSGSTGLTALVGSGTGRFRYNSDETSTNYTSALGAGLHAVYREAPTVQLTANSTLIGLSYNGAIQVGSEGVTDTTIAGSLKNGDGNAQLTGFLAYTYSSNGVATAPMNAGVYSVQVGGQRSALGYGVDYATGSLVIGKKEVQLIVNKTYDGTRTLTGNQLVIVTGVGSETLTYASATTSSKNVQDNKVNYVDSLVLTDGSNGGKANNFKFTALPGPSNSVAINPASLTLTANSDMSKVYNGTDQGVEGYTITSGGLKGNDRAAVDLMGIKAGGKGTDAGSYTTSVNDASYTNPNYTIVKANGTLVIARKEVRLLASKEYDGSKTLTSGQLNIQTGVAFETLGFSAATIHSKNVADNSLNFVNSVTLNDGSNGGKASNYTFTPSKSANNTVQLTPLALSGSIGQGHSIYGDALVPGGASFTNVVLSDDVSASTVTVTTAGQTSTSGHLKSGFYSGVQSLVALRGADAGNYTFANIKGDYRVDKRALTGVTIDAANKTYGDVVQAGAVNFAGSSLKAGDVVQAQASVQRTAANLSTSGNLRVGSYDQKVSELISGNANNDADNYSFSAVTNAGSYTVSKLALTGVTVDAANKTYGDAVQAGAVNFAGSSLKAGDVVQAQASVQRTAANLSTSGNLRVGSYDQKVSELSSANANNDADNYSFSAVTNVGNYTVSKKVIGTAQIAAVTDAVYGTAKATGAVSLGADVLAGDLVSASNAATVKDPVNSSSNNLKAGDYKQTVQGGLSSGNANNDAGNYSFAGMTSGTANYRVEKLALLSQIADVNVVYGSPVITGVAQLVGVRSGDTVNLSDSATVLGADYSSSGKLKVGSYAQMVGNLLTGSDADNYKAVPTTTVANYVVQPKPITATMVAADKVYDGSNVASMTAQSKDIYSGDAVLVLGVTGTFASKNVSRDSTGNVMAQTVTVMGSSVGLGGGDGANYTLSNAANIASTTAAITPKVLTATGMIAANKVYDGSTTATVTASRLSLLGTLAGESVNVSAQNAKGQFDSKNVAYDPSGAVTTQAVTVTGLTLSGPDSGNYSVIDQSGASAKVLQRAVALTGSVAQNKTADGTTEAQITPGKLVNLVAGESLLVTATGQFADAQLGTNKWVSVRYGLLDGGNGIARNYMTPSPELLRAAIVSSAVNPVQPLENSVKPALGRRPAVSGGSSTGAAMGQKGVNDAPADGCTALSPEICE